MNSTNGKKRSINSLSDLTPDTKNANKGTQRGRGLLEKSLRQYGAGRSVLVDRDGEIIAGNKTVEIAAEIDLPIRVVETDGNELVVVQRTDLELESKGGRGLAVADNRTSEVSLDWDADVLNSLSDNIDLSDWGFTDAELDYSHMPTEEDWAKHFERNLPPVIQDSFTISFTCNKEQYDLIKSVLSKIKGQLDTKMEKVFRHYDSATS